VRNAGLQQIERIEDLARGGASRETMLGGIQSMLLSLPPVVNIVLLSLVAGLGTGLGGLIAVLRKPGRRSFGFMMGITAGVMISLSFLELVNEAWELSGYWTATIGFTIGAIFMLLIDYFIPHIRFGETETRQPSQNPDVTASKFHVIHSRRRQGHRRGFWRQTFRERNPGLVKTGVLLAVGITIHNIPEGIAVGAGYMHVPEFGLFIAAAILLHNIPEGIATALPLCQGGVCRWNSFRAAFLSGLAEPVGALAAALLLNIFSSLVPAALAFAGGVMVFITLDELVPTAREHGHQHFTALGIILGSVFVFTLSGLLGV
jgi:ZIP family zinc transporter